MSQGKCQEDQGDQGDQGNQENQGNPTPDASCSVRDSLGLPRIDTKRLVRGNTSLKTHERMPEGTLSFLYLSEECPAICCPRECSEFVALALANDFKGDAEAEGGDRPVIALREDERRLFEFQSKGSEICDVNHRYVFRGEAAAKLFCSALLAEITTLKEEHANCRELPLPEERARTFPETYARVEPRNEEEHMPRPSLALLL